MIHDSKEYNFLRREILVSAFVCQKLEEGLKESSLGGGFRL